MRTLGRLALLLLAFPWANSHGLAQADLSARTHPVPASGVREGGTYHVATQAWTRKARAANVGADVVYDNTCATGYFFPLSGDRLVDEGRLPSLTSPTNVASRPGCGTEYTIDGFQIAYCTDQAGFAASTTTVNFYESYASCSSVSALTPTASFALTGLPGASIAPTCWVVTLDLDAPPLSSSLAFAMAADGDGTYVAPESSNLFGWSIEFSLPDAAQASTGPLIAGDANVCSRFDGTRWDSPVNYGEQGTGMGTRDEYYVENGPTPPGCYFGSGGLLRSFHLELYADACAACLTTCFATYFCFGDGSGTPCPCANHSPVGDAAGCVSSIGLGAKLRASGTPSLSADTLVLAGTWMPAAASCLYFQGTTRAGTPSGSGTMFGDGKRCAGGSVLRLGTKTSAAGASQYPVAGDLPISVQGAVTVPGAVRTYQAWYRNAASFCTTATFNLSNGAELVWGP